MKILLAAILAIVAPLAAFSQTAQKHKARSLPQAFIQAELIDNTGASFSLNDYRGRVVLLHTWGKWCRPCRAEIPGLVEIQSKFRDQGFTIIGVNVGDERGHEESWPAINSFAKQSNISYRLVKVKAAGSFIRQLDKLTGAEVVPQTILLDRRGRIRAAYTGSGSEIDQSRDDLISEILKER